jgi:predicted metal-dependent hydrolase
MTVLDWRRGELAEGLRLYRAHNYFEAHEQWEALWRRSHGPEKNFLQAMIQVAAACHHYERGNRRGTRSLLKAALRRLSTNNHAAYEGSQSLVFREALSLWLATLEESCASMGEPPAEVRLLSALDD